VPSVTRSQCPAFALLHAKEALEAARKIVDKMPAELAADKNVWALYETFLSQPISALVRFGMWDEVLAEPKPDVESRFMTGIWHYARALAFIHTDRLTESRRGLRALTAAREATGELEHYIGFGIAQTLLTIAEEIVRGELAYAEGSTLEGLAHLERADGSRTVCVITSRRTGISRFVTYWERCCSMPVARMKSR
jgi:hypothetical protein